VSFWKKLFGSTATLQSSAEPVNKQTLQVPQVEFQREEHKSHPAASHIKITKKIYSAQSKEAAIRFLQMQRVTEPFYYIEVDTPSGRFGIDNGDRIFDNKGNFIESEPEPEKVTYDTLTLEMKSALENAMAAGQRQIPPQMLEREKTALQCLRVIIDDASADFYMRRMAVWWGGQFNNADFNAFLSKRFVDGKDRVKLYQKAESSQSDIARAEEGLHIAVVDMLSSKQKT
jgi:hypothetical protein